MLLLTNYQLYFILSQSSIQQHIIVHRHKNRRILVFMKSLKEILFLPLSRKSRSRLSYPCVITFLWWRWRWFLNGRLVILLGDDSPLVPHSVQPATAGTTRAIAHKEFKNWPTLVRRTSLTGSMVYWHGGFFTSLVMMMFAVISSILLLQTRMGGNRLATR